MAVGATFLHPVPQPGDGSWLLQQGKKRRRRHKKAQTSTFLTLNHPHNTENRANGEYTNQAFEADLHRETFLQSSHKGKERPWSPEQRLPRFTTESGSLLSRMMTQPKPPTSSSTIEFQNTAHTLLRNDSVLQTATVRDTTPTIEETDMAPVTRGMAPHLRNKIGTDQSAPMNGNAPETPVDSRPVTNGDHDAQAYPSPTDSKDIRQKLADDYGVKVSEPHTATASLVAYPSSSEEHHGAPNGNSQSYPNAVSRGRSNRGDYRARGGRRGRGGQGFRGRGFHGGAKPYSQHQSPNERTNETSELALQQPLNESSTGESKDVQPSPRGGHARRWDQSSRAGHSSRGVRGSQGGQGTRGGQDGRGGQNNRGGQGARNGWGLPHAFRGDHNTRGGPNGRGGQRNGGGRGDKNPGNSRWPTKKETQADPHRWDINWDSEDQKSSSEDSAWADAGDGGEGKKRKHEWDGIDANAGYHLTDWDGNWAPPPLDWDSRPAFRPEQSTKGIERWMDGVEEEMVGKQSAVSVEDAVINGIAYYFTSQADETEGRIMGDLAPRYWIPITFGRSGPKLKCMAPQTFWNEFVKSETPKPCDVDDLMGVKPWWEMYEITGGNFLQAYPAPDIKGIDPDESRDDTIARENDKGSAFATENRKAAEKAKKAEKIKLRIESNMNQRTKKTSLDPDSHQQKIKTDIKVHVRPAFVTDISDIQEIYNHYVEFSICTPETVRRTTRDIAARLQEVKNNKLPFLIAYEKHGRKPGNMGRKYEHHDIFVPDKILGFAFADDYNDMQGMYRFTAEIEVYVDSAFYMKGVAKCLLDKLISMLDPDYIRRGGYELSWGAELNGSGPSRRISNLIVNLPYDAAKTHRRDWIQRWLGTWLGFEKVGDLKGIGVKDEKTVNLAIFQRKTGEVIDPLLPPVAMS